MSCHKRMARDLNKSVVFVILSILKCYTKMFNLEYIFILND